MINPHSKRPILLSALIWALAASPSLWADDQSCDEVGPAKTVASFHDALATGDRDGALALLAPDVSIYESGWAELSREEYSSHHLAGDMAFVAATTQEVTDQSSGVDGNTAWVLTRSTTKGSYKDREIDNVGTETMLLQRTEGGWQIIHIHWSSHSQKTSH